MEKGTTWNNGMYEYKYIGLCEDDDERIHGKAMYYEYRIEEREDFHKRNWKPVYFLPLNELMEDKERHESERVYREKARIEREKEEREEREAKEKRENTHGFTDEMNPMRRGKVLKTLLKLFRYDGIVKSRKENIEEKVKNGWFIDENSPWGKIFRNDERSYSFNDEKNLTKTGMKYAEYLISINFHQPETMENRASKCQPFVKMKRREDGREGKETMRLNKALKTEILKTGKIIWKKIKANHKYMDNYSFRLFLDSELLKLGKNLYRDYEKLYLPEHWEYNFPLWAFKDSFRNNGNLWNQLNELQKVKLLSEIMKED